MHPSKKNHQIPHFCDNLWIGLAHILENLAAYSDKIFGLKMLLASPS